MSKLREFIERAPDLIGVEGHNAKRWAFPLLAMFDADVAKDTDIFDLKPGEELEDRFDVLNGLYMAKGAKREKVAFFIGQMILAAYSCAVSKGLEEYVEKRDRLAEHQARLEPENAELAAVLSVADASTMSLWA